MKTTYNLSINKSINFGTKVPTENILSLASNRCNYKIVNENKKIITKLASNKNWESRVSHPIDVFIAMSSMLREKYPNLCPYVLKIVDPLFCTEYTLDYELNFQNVIKEAEKNLGKEFDIDPKHVDNVLEKLYV